LKFIGESNYEIEYNNELYKLKTVARTLSELRDAIKSKIKFQGSVEIVLHFKENGKFFVLDDFRDLKEGMTIRISISSQSQPSSRIFYFFLFYISYLFYFYSFFYFNFISILFLDLELQYHIFLFILILCLESRIAIS